MQARCCREAELLTAQLAGLDAWHRSWRDTTAVDDGTRIPRETRLDLKRRTEARLREHSALIARSDAQLRGGPQPPGLRTVIAHRNAWFRDKVAAALDAKGVAVTASVDDGAEAAAAIVLDQPQIVLVEDLLPSVPGHQVVTRARELAPASVLAVQVGAADAVAAFLDAGARAVFTRRVPPVDVAETLLRCLHDETGPITVL